MEKLSFPHISAKVICDSESAASPHRLTTFEIRLPRIILAEFNTHKSICRNASSSRAIPCAKLRREASENPFIPVWFGATQKGMSAANELTGWRLTVARCLWLSAGMTACKVHWLMEKVGLHKQIANRIIEPWLSTTVVATGTDAAWANFFKLRCAPDAQPEIRAVANAMKKAYDESKPQELKAGEWHLPYIDENERKMLTTADAIKISVARCCRTSYNNMLGKKSQLQEDIALFHKVTSAGHFSPTEHQGVVPGFMNPSIEKHIELQRGFRGFYQLRSFIEDETDASIIRDELNILL